MHTINILNLRCRDERNELSASEEIYALVTSVKLSPLFPGIPPIPSFDVFRYGVWENFDEGETKSNTGPPFWGLTSTPEQILNRNDVIFVVTLMENDHGDPNQYRSLVKLVATSSLASTLTLPRAAKVTSLVRDITDALNGVRLPIPFALDDDHIRTLELRLRTDDLITTGTRNRRLEFRSSEGFYDVNFSITAS